MSVEKRLIIFSIIIALAFIVPVLGISANLEECTSCEGGDDETISLVNIEDAVNLYSYEISFDVSGEGVIASTDFQNFLGAGAQGGNLTNSTSHVVYESILDNNSSGVNGSDAAFSITYNDTLTLTLNSAIFAFADGSVETVSFVSGGSGGSSGGGGGGGGTTTTTSETSSITVFPEELEVTVVESESETAALALTNGGSDQVNLSIELGALGSFVEVDSSNITLDGGERESISFDFTPNRAAGIITGSIKFYEGSTLAVEVPVTLNIRSENFLFDITITNINSILGASDTLRSQIDLVQSGEEKEVEIEINYMIKNFADEVYYMESETRTIIGQDSFIKETDLGSLNLPPGSYIFGLEASYEGELGTTSARFEVNPLESPSFIDRNWIIVIALGSIVLILIIVLVIKHGRGKSKVKRKK